MISDSLGHVACLTARSEARDSPLSSVRHPGSTSLDLRRGPRESLVCNLAASRGNGPPFRRLLTTNSFVRVVLASAYSRSEGEPMTRDWAVALGSLCALVGGLCWVVKGGWIPVTGWQPPVIYEVAPLFFPVAAGALFVLLGVRSQLASVRLVVASIASSPPASRCSGPFSGRLTGSRPAARSRADSLDHAVGAPNLRQPGAARRSSPARSSSARMEPEPAPPDRSGGDTGPGRRWAA